MLWVVGRLKSAVVAIAQGLTGAVRSTTTLQIDRTVIKRWSSVGGHP